MRRVSVLVAVIAAGLVLAGVWVGDSSVAGQSDRGVWHEVYRLDEDGMARVWVSVQLPGSFDDVDASAVVRVGCDGGVICHRGLLSVVETVDQGKVGTFSLRVPPGDNAVDIVVRAIKQSGDAVTYAIGGHRISAPEPQPLGVGFAGYRVSDINADGSVNMRLKFTLRRPDSWPIMVIKAVVLCEGGEVCGGTGGVLPDWSGDSAASDRMSWEVTVRNVPTGRVQLGAAFDPDPEEWFGASRVARIDGIVVESTGEISDLINPNVSWEVASMDVKGYYMDGSALVGLGVSAELLDGSGSVGGVVKEVCLEAEIVGGEGCQSLGDPVTMRLDPYESALVQMELRLPPGEHSLIVSGGELTGAVDVEVEEKIVMSRDMWECFNDGELIAEIVELFGQETCGGWVDSVVRRWVLETVNVYREGDPAYVEIFDDVLGVMSGLTGINYVIVDEVEAAEVEAYVGHEGHPRVLELLGEYCNTVTHCTHVDSSTFEHHTVDIGIVSIWHMGDLTQQDRFIRRQTARSVITEMTKRVLIPTGHDNRPFHQGLRDPETMLRPHDVPMYRLYYSPKASPGTRFVDLRDSVVFEEETIDYESGLPPADIVAHKVTRAYSEAGSITIEMIGSELRGRAVLPGTRLTAQFADYSWLWSDRIKFWTDSWSSIIFGFDEESWSSAGGRWTQSEAHEGRGRRYRDELKFDFPLVDPTNLVYTELRRPYTAELTKNSFGQYVYRSEFQPGGRFWPYPNIEIVIDPESYRMVSYTITWHFDADGRVRLPYRVEATVLEYGSEFDIPEEVREGSAWLAGRE